MNSTQPDPPVWNKPNLTHMFIGINIYHDAMRRYIGKEMRGTVEGDWFRTRVIDTIENQERKERLQRNLDRYGSTSGEEGLIEVSDIPDIVSAQRNSDVIHDQLRERELVRRMRMIREWRNNWAHPPLTDNDCEKMQATNALDSCACVLRPVDERAANQVRGILNNPYSQKVLQHVQKEHEETKYEPEAEKDQHKKTQKTLEKNDKRLSKIKKSQRKFLKARIRNLLKWLNDFLHQPMDRSIPKPPRNMLETCEIMLKVVDEEATGQKSWLKHQPDALLRLENERLLQGTTIRDLRNTFDEVRRQLEANHEKTNRELARVRQELKNAEKCKQQLDEMQRDLKVAQQQLEREQSDRKKIEQQLNETKLSQTQSKPSAVPVNKQVKEYRKRFKYARSGNGWTRSTEVEDWFITRWVGKKLGKDYACVFAPSRGWIEATEGPLFDQPCSSEEEAFKYLQDLDHRGKIDQLAREAIKEYNALLSMPNSVRDDSVPDSVSDDDIPF